VKRYGQYCPVARAAEVLAERWTLLVIRELLVGNDRYRAISDEALRVTGDADAARALPDRLGASPYADVQRAPESLPRLG
jgi:hypothetical protein